MKGRPRKHDRDKIAADLLEWVQKNDSINLNKFCAINLLPPSKLSEWAKEDNDFREAYETAKTFLGFRREEMLNSYQLHVKAYDLNAATYDYFLKEEKRLQAEFETSLKLQEQQIVSEEQQNNYNAFMDMLGKYQSVSKDALNSNNIE